MKPLPDFGKDVKRYLNHYVNRLKPFNHSIDQKSRRSNRVGPGLICFICVLLFVTQSFAAEIGIKQIDEFIKRLITQNPPVRWVETYYEIRIIDRFEVKQVQKVKDKDIYEAEIEFNVVSINKEDERTWKLVKRKLPEPRKETMKYNFVIEDDKLMLYGVPHSWSYSLKTK